MPARESEPPRGGTETDAPEPLIGPDRHLSGITKRNRNGVRDALAARNNELRAESRAAGNRRVEEYDIDPALSELTAGQIAHDLVSQRRSYANSANTYADQMANLDRNGDYDVPDAQADALDRLADLLDAEGVGEHNQISQQRAGMGLSAELRMISQRYREERDRRTAHRQRMTTARDEGRRVRDEALREADGDPQRAQQIIRERIAREERERPQPAPDTAGLPPAARAAVEAARARQATGTSQDDITAASYKRRVDALPELSRNDTDPVRIAAAALQQAGQTGTPKYVGIAPGGSMRMYDAEPDRSEVQAWIRANPDGRMESSAEPGHLHPWSDEEVHRFFGPTVANLEQAGERDRVEPEFHTGADGESATTPAGHIDTSGFRDGMRVEAHEALDAIARVHRVDGMPTMQTSNLPGEHFGAVFSTGLNAALKSSQRPGGRGASTLGSDLIGVNPDVPHAALNIAHEYGHAIDLRGLDLGTKGGFGTHRMMGNGAEAPEQHAAMQRLLKAIRRTDTYASLTAYGPHSDGDPESTRGKHLSYLRQSDELWARAYAQFIATRSGSAKLRAQLDEIRATQAGANHPPFQWTDEEFEPIDAAIADVLRARGWMD